LAISSIHPATNPQQTGRATGPHPERRGGASRKEDEMRGFLGRWLPAALLLVFLGIIVAACGGGGGGGGGGNPVTLNGLSVAGPASVSEYGTGTYAATASWDDNTTTTVTATWSVNSQVASISSGGVLSCGTIDADQTVTVSATYTAGGVTETNTMNVTLTNIVTKPFTAQMLSGAVLFDENFGTGGAYDSSLIIFDDNSTYHQYYFEAPPGVSDSQTGSWSIDASGKLLLDIGGQPTVTVELVGDLGFGPADVLVDDGTGTPFLVHMEIASPGPYPFDSPTLPGTYVVDSGPRTGETWVFRADGTGSTTGDGGFTFTWSVDGGILKVVFPNGYEAWMYLRNTTQPSGPPYTLLKWAFVMYDPSHNFYFYYGGMDLARQ
jgi:hypothetical protein